MNRETRIALLAAYASLLALLLGYFSARGDSDQAELLSNQVQLSGEYVDFILTKRLSAVAPADEELLLVKEELIQSLRRNSAEMIRRSKLLDWGILGLTISLILLQLKIVEETAAAEKALSKGLQRIFWMLYYGALGLSILSILWSFAVPFL